ncbi:MAG TPA: tRNA uridine-5-carboxymethylaminomethyl(34) synthesis GTPase MnmE [Candidatus Gallacutalibacter stercoravium]|nr:tRNA uridine-5-carboxymethylaminomethyl(34) synthesis GTPase MnmE [Candidatus Gallacutalibacter stercoravium]
MLPLQPEKQEQGWEEVHLQKAGRQTIAAISTPQGVGGIGVIRISGPEAIAVADKIFLSASGAPLCQKKGYTAAYGHVMDGEAPLDEAVALVFRAPHSYTGEDVVELSCHGGVYITRRVLQLLYQQGAVPAQPGEFTQRAFLNGKMDLTQAEAVMDLIGAKGRQAAKAAMAGKEGALQRRMHAIEEVLLDAAAHLAAWADYPEEDIGQVDTQELAARLNEQADALEQLLGQYSAGRALQDGIATVIVGRPNVGKSTLMNLLAGCERSIVTDIPGTTRDVVEDTVLVGDIPLRLADTAGLRDTTDPVESIGVNRAKSKLETAALILAVFDASQPLNEDDRQLLRSLRQQTESAVIAIINKTDLPARLEVEEIAQWIPNQVFLSAGSGEGLESLQNEIARVAGVERLDPQQGMLATERQCAAAGEALSCLREALGALWDGMTLDAVTVSLDGALQALLELTGQRASEAVVQQVFSHFCVGK